MDIISARKGKEVKDVRSVWLRSVGHRVMALVLIMMSLWVPSGAYAYDEIQDKRFVPVEYDGLVWYTLDATTIKRYTGLSGDTLVDVWMEGPAYKAGPSMDPALLNSAWVKDLNEGFLGWPWGIQAKMFAGIRHLVDIPPNLMVYSANLDLTPILGSVSAYSSPRLVFDKDGGLVKAHMDFDAKEYDAIHARLTELLGEPNPIIYELRTVRMDFIQRSEWLVGGKTKLVLTWKGSGATIEISKRDFIMPESPSVEDIIAAAQWKRAQEYEQQNRILEASSLYQELLNGTGSYRDFTSQAQERLAKYSQLNEATVYLSEHRDLVFYGLKNIFSDSVGQQWVRINLGSEARQELQQQRTGIVQDKLSNIGAVLCRVKVIPVGGKYSVVEQIWLDDANQIIGGRPAWTIQDSCWPVPYIKQSCEEFLEAWFTVGSTSG